VYELVTVTVKYFEWKGLFGAPRIRFNVSTRVPIEVATFFLAVGSTLFEVEV
jgi:hypothetical protein